ncbi:MAG: hypothetical protein HDR82_10965 [Bacteroides sp.]|nr:hypothetical protein [Bacteroides sp.]
MKKSLLFSAAAMLLAGAMSAQTFTAETVWSYDVKDGKSNNVPGLDGGWSGFSATKLDPATATCSRFGVGRNGKILTTDHIKNAIIAIDQNGVTTFKELPARTADRWNGTVVTTDDAGNVIINYNFTNATGSAQEWAVITKDGNLYNLTCSSSLANQGGTGRVDIMGHVVGDVTSAEGAIGYVTTMNSGSVIKMIFKGNGTTPTELDCVKAYDYPLGALTAMAGSSQLASACPRFTTVAEINAFEGPAFIIPLGVTGNAVENCPSIEDGWVGKFIPGWTPSEPAMGNRQYAGIAYFELGGKSYIVRNYITPEFQAKYPNAEDPAVTAFGKYQATMNFAVYEYDATNNTAEIAATWQESEYSNGFGMGTLTAEVVDDKTVNIYTYAATGSKSNINTTITPTEPGVYCAMVRLTLNEQAEDPKTELKGSGTEADPYLIATPEDLCAAHLYIPQAVAGDYVYFKQTADIDMANADYTKWEALNGWGGQYNGKFVYDGDNHLIKNFNPGTTDRDPVDNEGGYYEASIFGVLRGTVKNLGIIDATSVSNGGFDGAGIISDYSGQGGVDAEITNVFVTGKVAGNKRIGGMLAHAGGNNSLTDVYAVVEINAENCPAGGIIGNLNGKSLSIDGGYVSAVITGANSANGLVAGGTAGSVDTYGFVAIGQGDAYASGIDVVENNASKFDSYTTEAKNAIVAIAAFSDGKMLNDMPTFNWVSNQSQGGDDVADIKGSGTLEDPYLIATAADLCEAHNLINQEVAGDYVHFKQTADIDMANADYTKWQALLGWYGAYAGKIKYDGDYHVIRNFKPTDKESIGNAVMEDIEGFGGYYDTSLFGVLRGEVKNLGVINYEGVDQTAGGAAAIAGYSGHSGEAAVVTNVFVTGKVSGNKRNGAIAATMSADNIYTDVYAVIEVNSTNAPAGGLVGTLNNNKLTLDGGYVAATITGTPSTQGLIAGGNGTAEVYNFITIGQGERFATTDVDINEIESPKFDSYDDTVERCILDMDAFFEGKKLNGMPTFNWMTDAQIASVDNVVVDNDNQDAPAIYYNLQGVRVENPANGLYIKKQGNKVSKVVIR